MNLDGTPINLKMHAILENGLIVFVSFLKRKTLIVLLFLISAISTIAQKPSYFQFSTDNGLPSNETYKIIEDKKGYIWIATDRGVVRYDGYEFEVFTTEDGLTNNVVFWIYEDYKGRIWFSGRDNSLCYFENGTFIQHPASEKLRKLPNRLILSIYVNNENIIWIGSYGRVPVIKLFPNGEIEEVAIPGAEFRDFVVFEMDEKNVIFGIIIEGSEGLAQKKVLIYDKNSLLLRSFQFSVETEYSFTSLISSNDQIYLTYGQIFYALDDSKVGRFKHSSKFFTNSLFQDNSGTLWSGFKNGGVVSFKDENFNKTAQKFLEEWTVSSVFEDREGGFWFSTTEAGIFYYPSRTIENLGLFDEKIVEIRHAKDLVWGVTSAGLIYEISETNGEHNFEEIYSNLGTSPPTYVDYESNFWISNRKPLWPRKSVGVTINPKPGLSFKQMVRLQDSTLWVCTRSELQKLSWPDLDIIESFPLPSSRNRVMALEAFSSDELLLGDLEGLWVFKDGEIKRFEHTSKIFESRINDLEILSNKDIVIASLGEGVIRVSKDGRIKQVTKKDGLLSGLINCSYTLSGDSITWVGSSRGLSQINWLPNYPDSIEILNFTIFNGLNSNEILAIDFIEDKLWVGTAKGITVIKPDDFNSLKMKPLIHLESVHINGVSTKDTTSYFLSTNDFVKIHFGGISMNSKGNMKYRYRIKGFDEGWEYISNRVLEFKLFTPGEYELEISSINASGVVSSNSIKRKFTVIPAFWQTWWFSTATVLFLILAIGFIFNRRYKIKQRENYLLTRSLETEQEALSSQITPHFLFNSLNSIQNLYQSNKSNNAVLHLSNFSRLMRRILQNTKLHSVLLSNELETIRLYMDLEMLRLNDNFEYFVNIDPAVDVDFVRLPPMIIQPLIENSIWHGILNKPDQNGKIIINFSIEKENLRIEILDDGVGREKAKEFKSNFPAHRKSTGLKSIRRRLEVLNEMHKTNLSFQIIDLKDKKGKALGTKIILNIPLDYE